MLHLQCLKNWVSDQTLRKGNTNKKDVYVFLRKREGGGVPYLKRNTSYKTSTYAIQNEAEVQIPFFAVVPDRNFDFSFSPVVFSGFGLYTKNLELVTC